VDSISHSVGSILSSFWDCHHRESDPSLKHNFETHKADEELDLSKHATKRHSDESESLQPDSLFDPHRRRRTTQKSHGAKRLVEDGDGLAQKEERRMPRTEGESVTAVYLMEEAFQLLEGLSILHSLPFCFCFLLLCCVPSFVRLLFFFLLLFLLYLIWF
jgi:hypothetical protein